jgi:nuclear exosome regulator NRDE2
LAGSLESETRNSTVKALSYSDDRSGRDHVDRANIKPRELKDQIWISDRKGDAMNEAYQSLNRSDVPRFRRVGYGRVMGTASGVKINRDESNENQVVLDIHERSDRPGRGLLSSSGKGITKHPIHLSVDKSNEFLDHASSFISLNKPRKRKRSPEVLGLGYDRNVPPSATDDLSSDNSSDYESEEDTDIEKQSQRDALIRQRNLKLTQTAKSEPKNLQNWRDLIKHQDDMIMLGHPGDKTLLDTAGKQSLADIKIMIYRDALAKLGDNLDAQEELWLGLLGEGEILWESKVLQACWREAIKALPKSAKIRLGHINYLQTSYGSFRFGASESNRRCILANNCKKPARQNISVALK